MVENQNTRILAYIEDVCSQIKFREIHREIKLEFRTHFQEIIEEYLSEGFSENQAVSRAINQMGSPGVVGKQLNRIHKPRPEWSILSLSFLMACLGLLAMYLIERQALYTVSPLNIFTKSLVFAIIGAGIAGGFYIFDYRKLEPYFRHIYLGTVSALFLVIIFGQNINGKHYLSIGGIYLDVIEVSPLLLCLALTGILNKWNWNQLIKWLQGFILCVVPLILMVASSSWTAGFIYSTVCITLLVASGAKNRYSLLMTGLLAVIIMLPFMRVLDRHKQFIEFFNPENNTLGSGVYVHTDFIFSYITLTFGWVAGGVLAALGVILILRMTRIAAAVKTRYARLLISGFAAIFAVQFLWNILMNLGLAPVSGVGLPFISFGGSQLIFNCAAIGIILGIHKRRNILENYDIKLKT